MNLNCQHKNPIPCNRNSCDGVEFVHYFHCATCGVALKPQAKPKQPMKTTEENWSDLLDRTDKQIMDWFYELLKVNFGVTMIQDSTELREILKDAFAQSREQTLKATEEGLKKIATYHYEGQNGGRLPVYSVKDVLDLLEEIK